MPENPSNRNAQTLPFGFTIPPSTIIGAISLHGLFEAVAADDREAILALRVACSHNAFSFDRSVAALRHLLSGHFAQANAELARIQSPMWRPCASALAVLATAAAGDMHEAVTLLNRARDLLHRRAFVDGRAYEGNVALLGETNRCFLSAENACAMKEGPLQVESPFSYLVSYPRSGSSYLRQFLAYAFAAPTYSVYPGAEWYFSRRFHDRAPGHAVFVKDHELRPEYLQDQLLLLVRDGRDAVVSFARYLHAGGERVPVGEGELADFLSYLEVHSAFGFWGTHTRALLDASERNPRARIVRYETIFGDYARLRELALSLADGAPIPYDDERGFATMAAARKRELALFAPDWSETVQLPEGSYIPKDWSIGGGSIDWRCTFDAKARRRFHELGGTEMLIRLGYETDENWWK